jgi:hypothetical protein
MTYILSCVIHKFFFQAGLLAVHQHLHLALLGPDHHRLLAHAADHVKRVHRTTAQRKFQNVLRHALFQRLFQIVGDLKKPVGRTQTPNTLVGPLVVVVLHPEGCALHRLLEAVKLGALQILVQYRLPEPLDFSEGHRMVRSGADVLDPVLSHLPLEPGLASPVRVLPAVVGEHLLGNAVLGNPAAVGLQHVFGRLAAIQPQGDDVPAVVVHEADQISVAARQAEGHDVALPQLIGTGSFEKPWLGRIFPRLAFGLFHQPLGGQSLVDGGLAGGDQKKTLEHIGDPARTVLRMSLLELHNPLTHLLRHTRASADPPLRFKTLDSAKPVGPHPALNRMPTDSKLLAKQDLAVTLLQVKSNHSQPEFNGIGQGSGGSFDPEGTALLSLFHGCHSSLCNWFLHSGVSPHSLNLAVP